MRKSVQLPAVVIAVAGLALALGLGIAQAQGPSGPTQPGSGGKQLPTPPLHYVAHKQTTPSPYISSCPIAQLPQPGVIQEALPNADPTYAFQSAAIGISGGQPYMVEAGYVRSKPTQGVISVQPISLDPCKDFVSHLGQPASQASVAPPVWTEPLQKGAITLTGVSGNTVSFTTAGGKAGHFDYVAQVYLP